MLTLCITFAMLDMALKILDYLIQEMIGMILVG